jgi:hypothetical protein
VNGLALTSKPTTSLPVLSQAKHKFFGVSHLPPPAYPTPVDFMKNQDSQNPSGHTKKLSYYLNIALGYPFLGHQTTIANFMAKLLDMMITVGSFSSAIHFHL